MPFTLLGVARRRATSRRTTAAVAAVLMTAPLLAALSLTAGPANAKDPLKFEVIGTSDVKDSGLVANVLEPDFEAYEANTLGRSIDLVYTGKGTGDALNLAKTGAYAAVIVHAASLENQFVADGYSAEPYGRALTYGDFILAGRTSDSAGVTTNGALSHDMVTAYEKIAAKGATGGAEFVSRGGTPGTSVSEHQIWALTSGVTLCNVDPSEGGGKRPTTAADGSACPLSTATGQNYPAWYHVNLGSTQAANIQIADACNGYASTDCYVFTDRGTFNNLQCQHIPASDPNCTSALAHLVIQVRDNAADARGGEDLLINNFHAYAVNPAKFPNNPGKTDLQTATEFLNFITSPAEQDRIDGYLSTATNGDVPFHKSAAPDLSVVPPASQVVAGQAITVSGVLSNKVPGTLPLNGETVHLLARFTSLPDSTPTQIASTTTGPTGAFQFTYAPKASLTYSVSTDQITKIEVPKPKLDPEFGDILQPTTTVAGPTAVTARVSLVKANKVGADKRSLQVQGNLVPQVIGSGAKLAIFVEKSGATTFTQAGVQPLAAGATTYVKTFKLPGLAKGTYQYQIRYVNNGVLQPGSTKSYTVTF